MCHLYCNATPLLSSWFLFARTLTLWIEVSKQKRTGINIELQKHRIDTSMIIMLLGFQCAQFRAADNFLVESKYASSLKIAAKIVMRCVFAKNHIINSNGNVDLCIKISTHNKSASHMLGANPRVSFLSSQAQKGRHLLLIYGNLRQGM